MLVAACERNCLSFIITHPVANQNHWHVLTIKQEKRSKLTLLCSVSPPTVACGGGSETCDCHRDETETHAASSLDLPSPGYNNNNLYL